MLRTDSGSIEAKATLRNFIPFESQTSGLLEMLTAERKQSARTNINLPSVRSLYLVTCTFLYNLYISD